MAPDLKLPTADETRAWIVARAPAMLAAFDEANRSEARGHACSDRPGATSSDNAAYAGALLSSLVRGIPAVCVNPGWDEEQRREAARVLSRGPEGCGASGDVLIPTGGTGGKIRFVRHDLATLAAAVSGFSRYAGERLLRTGKPAVLHAVQALPCCHVSGLMPVVRAWLTGGEVVFADPSFRPDTPLPAMPRSDDGLGVVSLVAAQLHRLSERPDGPAWLRTAGLVLVGGSAVAPELLDRARRERIPVGVSYGLTEAAALVALYPPERFLRGEPVAGDVLPHLAATITPEGRIALSGGSIARDVREADGRFVTGDEGYLEADGRLVVTGRADRIVVTGGEKADPQLVEAAIRSTGLVREIHVTGEPHPEWGRRLVAYYTGDVSPAVLKDAASALLRGFMMPKSFVRSATPLFDEKGKVDRTRLRHTSDGDV